MFFFFSFECFKKCIISWLLYYGSLLSAARKGYRVVLECSKYVPQMSNPGDGSKWCKLKIFALKVNIPILTWLWIERLSIVPIFEIPVDHLNIHQYSTVYIISHDRYYEKHF